MEFCLNDNNAGGVYPKFDVTFAHLNAAAANTLPITYYNFTANGAGNVNPAEIMCLCSKCRPAA